MIPIANFVEDDDNADSDQSIQRMAKLLSMSQSMGKHPVSHFMDDDFDMRSSGQLSTYHSLILLLLPSDTLNWMPSSWKKKLLMNNLFH